MFFLCLLSEFMAAYAICPSTAFPIPVPKHTPIENSQGSLLSISEGSSKIHMLKKKKHTWFLKMVCIQRNWSGFFFNYLFERKTDTFICWSMSLMSGAVQDQTREAKSASQFPILVAVVVAELSPHIPESPLARRSNQELERGIPRRCSDMRHSIFTIGLSFSHKVSEHKVSTDWVS